MQDQRRSDQTFMGLLVIWLNAVGILDIKGI